MGKSTTVQTADDDLETLRTRYFAQRNDFALSVSALVRKVSAGEIDPDTFGLEWDLMGIKLAELSFLVQAIRELSPGPTRH